MTLYEINDQLAILEEYSVDPDTGELLDEDQFNAKFDEIQMALNDKIESSICFVKNLNAEVEAFKTEEKNLAQRRKVKENLAERIKNRIDTYIKAQYTDEDGNVDTAGLNKYKMETPKMKLSYRKSESVNITDIDSVPKEYIKTKTEVSADKTNIKKAIKAGQHIDGAELVTNINMQVK
jgi:hypothetical protein